MEWKRTVVCLEEIAVLYDIDSFGCSKSANYLISRLQNTRNAPVTQSVPAKCGIAVAIRHVTQTVCQRNVGLL